MTSQVAAFDFDGTLTRRDTLVPFLRRVSGDRAVMSAFTRRSFTGLAVALGRADRDALKASVVGELLAGRVDADLAAEGERYAGEIVGRGLRPDTLARLRWHQAAGHRTVIVSASLAWYLRPLAAALEVDDVLCTELEVGPNGRLTGRLVGRNCRGPEKATRLLAWSGGQPDELWAYGDSAGDDDLLRLADHAHRVRGVVVAASPDDEAPA